MKHVAICTAANETYACGVAVALVSAVAHAPAGAAIRVYVLDGGLRESSWQKLAASLPGCELTRLRPDLARFAGLPQDWGSSVMTYARLALPEMITEDLVLYIDADLIVQADWTALWAAGTAGEIVAAATDVITPTLGQERLPLEKFGLAGTAPYFQAGFLLLDLDAWRAAGVSAQVLTYLRENPEHSRYWDQSALNVVLYRRWKLLPATWNTPAWWADQAKGGCDLRAAVLHFVGPDKPWIYGRHTSPSAALYYNWLDRTAWKGWRPSGLRQTAKWLKYKVWQLRHDRRALLGAKR